MGLSEHGLNWQMKPIVRAEEEIDTALRNQVTVSI
jgi:hypothetical protein